MYGAPHTHRHIINTDPDTGSSSSRRTPSSTTDDDINYADTALRNGWLRPRQNRRDHGG